MKQLVLRLAKICGLFRIARAITRNRVRILGYHGIWFLDGHYGDRLFMSPEKFRDRLAWLRNQGYQVISLDEAIGKATRHHSVVITIDDGWFSTYKYMLPLLEASRFPATLYVYTGAVESQRPLLNIMIPALVHLSQTKRLRVECEQGQYLDFEMETAAQRTQAAASILDLFSAFSDEWVSRSVPSIVSSLGFDCETILGSRQFSFMTYDEIADAARRGLNIQLHTHSHRLRVDAPEQIVSEVEVNRSKLAPHVSLPLTHFCYPGGVHSPEMFSYLNNCGVSSATTVECGLVTSRSNPYALPRILDGQHTTDLEFEAELCGFLEVSRRVRGWLPKARRTSIK